MAQEYVLSESDKQKIGGLVDGFERRHGTTRTIPPPPPPRPGPPPDDSPAPDCYIARTPTDGIPAMERVQCFDDGSVGTGTGSGTGSGTSPSDARMIWQPGSAACAIWKVIPAREGCGPELVEAQIADRTVLNISLNLIPGSSFVRIHRDKYGGAWLADPDRTAGVGSHVLILEVVGRATTLFPCGPSISEGDACDPMVHLALSQEWDESCNRWNDGDCVFVVDVNSKTLEVGTRYQVLSIDRQLSSEVHFPVPPCSAAFSSVSIPFPVDLHVVDIGDYSRTVRVDGVVGRLCEGTAVEDEDNLKVYYGPSQRWNPQTCTWDDIETAVYIAERHGKELVIGERYVGDHERMLTQDDIESGGPSGTGTGDATFCVPLYLVDCKGFTGTKTVVADITCEEPDGSLPDPTCSGLCIWQWVGGSWLNSFSNCSVGCECPSPPNFPGMFEGQEEIRLCIAPGGGGTDPGGASLMAVYMVDYVYECGEVISASDPYFSHYAGCCDCSSSGVDPDGPGTGTSTGPGPGTGTGTGTAGGCSGDCTWQWQNPGFPSIPGWVLISTDCVGDANCECVQPDTPGTTDEIRVIPCASTGGVGGFAVDDEALIQRLESILTVKAERLGGVSARTVTRSGRVVNKPRAGIAQAGRMTAVRKSRCRKLKSLGLPCPDDPKSMQAPKPASAQAQQAEGLPPAGNWACGMLTVPARRKTLLPWTLQALSHGGFPRPWLFVDGDKDVKGWEDEFGPGVTCRDPALGVVGNTIQALWELWVRNPKAARYALFQDDFVMSRNVRQYLDRCPWPENGWLNLYTFSAANELHVKDKPEGWHQSALTDKTATTQVGRGAVALVFDRLAMLALLGSPILAWKPIAEIRPRKNMDGCIATALNGAGFREWIIKPSLVQHTGFETSRGAEGAPYYANLQALTFKGRDFDALTLLPREQG